MSMMLSLMYEYKDVTDVADFEEIAPKTGTVILADASQLIFYELLLALLDVHHSFIVASANIVMIEKECMNVDWDH
jgi:hypothetical protein